MNVVMTDLEKHMGFLNLRNICNVLIWERNKYINRINNTFLCFKSI